MTFQPIVPFSGIAGFRFIERTQDAQQLVFNKSPEVVRDVEYFRDNISKALTAEDLTSDFRLLKVALGAFGLEDEVSKKFFINKILKEGSEEPSALANRLVDPRYKELAEAFGYGNLLGTNVLQSDFANKIIDSYHIRQFESAVGNSDNSVRLAMNFKRDIEKYVGAGENESTPWYKIMGNTPIRTVLEGAYGFPTSIGALDVDRQLEMFQTKTDDIFGTESTTAFSDPDTVDRIIRDFLSREQLNAGPTSATRGYSALTLLQSGGIGSGSAANLLISKF